MGALIIQQSKFFFFFFKHTDSIHIIYYLHCHPCEDGSNLIADSFQIWKLYLHFIEEFRVWEVLFPTEFNLWV